MEYESYEFLRIDQHEGVISVAIDHPPLNLLDAKLIPELIRFVAEVRTDLGARVIVFSSADETFFIAHGDMNFIVDPTSSADLTGNTPSNSATNPMQQLNENLRALPQITIAKIAGLVRGGGLEFVMAADMRFAALGPTGLAHNETSLGIIPGGGGTQYLARLVGYSKALEIVVSSELVGAEEAERIGLINRALPKAELDTFVDAVSNRIASLAPGVAEAAKRAVNWSIDQIFAEGLAEENRLMVEMIQAPVAAKLTQAALDAGAQTRDGERDLEHIFDS